MEPAESSSGDRNTTWNWYTSLEDDDTYVAATALALTSRVDAVTPVTFVENDTVKFTVLLFTTTPLLPAVQVIVAIGGPVRERQGGRHNA
jgi:hypothetical protein